MIQIRSLNFKDLNTQTLLPNPSTQTHHSRNPTFEFQISQIQTLQIHVMALLVGNSTITRSISIFPSANIFFMYRHGVKSMKIVKRLRLYQYIINIGFKSAVKYYILRIKVITPSFCSQSQQVMVYLVFLLSSRHYLCVET